VINSYQAQVKVIDLKIRTQSLARLSNYFVHAVSITILTLHVQVKLALQTKFPTQNLYSLVDVNVNNRREVILQTFNGQSLKAWRKRGNRA